jgi:hypothetical protein
VIEVANQMKTTFAKLLTEIIKAHPA